MYCASLFNIFFLFFGMVIASLYVGMSVRAGLFVLDTNIFVASLKKMVMGHVGINVQTFRSLMNKF